MDIIKTPKRQ